MTWTEHALAVIDQARSEGEAKGLAGKDLLRHIDAAYPFGPRENHPYQCWLRARRQRCADLPGVRPLTRHRNPEEPARVNPLPGQMSFLEEPC